MKATGIIRRVDDLGRIVIPKEIRRVLGIYEGEPMEIFTEKDGTVIFKKYNPIDDGAWAKGYYIARVTFEEENFGLYDTDEVLRQGTDIINSGCKFVSVPLKLNGVEYGTIVGKVINAESERKTQRVAKAIQKVWEE